MEGKQRQGWLAFCTQNPAQLGIDLRAGFWVQNPATQARKHRAGWPRLLLQPGSTGGIRSTQAPWIQSSGAVDQTPTTIDGKREEVNVWLVLKLPLPIAHAVIFVAAKSVSREP